MGYLFRIFSYFPFTVLIVTLLVFVRPRTVRWYGKALWVAGLLFACSKFDVFRRLGSTYVPPLPEGLILFWNWAFCGAVFLCGLSLLFFWRFRWKGVVLPVVAGMLSSWGMWCALKTPDMREVELAYADLPKELDGYRILHISDLHASGVAREDRTRKIVDVANACSADLICLTGDYVDGDISKCPDVLDPLRDLRAKDGVWAVTGNHEWFGQQKGWLKWYADNGVRFLVNECVFPRPSLALGGVDDLEIVKYRRDLRARHPDVARTFAAATNGEFRVLLQHQPLQTRENFERHGVRLQLSGHTHGGIMPGLALAVKRYSDGFLRGVYRFGNGVLFVSTGCGQTADLPLRFFTPSEITLITLRQVPGIKRTEKEE